MKKYLILALIVLLIGALTVGVLADKKLEAGKSNIAHLYLYEKTDDGSMDWSVVEGGAWGKMKYNLSGSTFDFVFNGHNLKGEVDTEYTLIYYCDPWPGTPLICLGTGIVDEYGDIHIEGSEDTGDLPISGDLNANENTTTYNDGSTGAKIWLVLSDDMICGTGINWPWHPAEYLFEYELINFEYIED
jgi:hypothetical protein